MKILDRPSDISRWLDRLDRRRTGQREDALSAAAKVIREVRREGDLAVARLLRRFDGVMVSPGSLVRKPSRGEIDPRIAEAVERAITRVTAFHQRQKPKRSGYSIDGGELSHELRPLRRAGVYVPGGGAVYVSTLIMCAVPARIAGVAEIVVAAPPRAANSPELSWVCRRLGIHTIYQAGGPAAIAALAIGTESLERVDKVVGPGNRYVTAAKQLLTGEVGIDLIAGPSEIAVFADESASPAMVAADLLAQAEHGADSVSLCVTTSHRFARKLAGEITSQLRACPSHSAREAMRQSAILVAPSRRAAIDILDRVAPEHLSIQARNGRELAAKIQNCGAVFVGPFSPVALGDYIAGSNHVLPTGGAARFSSPLGVYDFYKRRSVVALSATTFRELAAPGRRLAILEGLPLHARSLQLREEIA